jgi:hypothetical protein
VLLYWTVHVTLTAPGGFIHVKVKSYNVPPPLAPVYVRTKLVGGAADTTGTRGIANAVRAGAPATIGIARPIRVAATDPEVVLIFMNAGRDIY